MRIVNAGVYNLKIPFSRTIRHNLCTRSETQSIVVVLQDDAGKTAYGEGAPRDYVTGETLESGLQSATYLLQCLVSRNYKAADQLMSALADVGKSTVADTHPAAFCAVEMAMFDMWARENTIPLYRLLSDRRYHDLVAHTGVIPIIKNETELLTFAALVKKLKLSSLKVKVLDVESGIRQLKAIRNILGNQIDLRIDANSAFTVETAIEFIKRARSIRLSAIEQPVERNDLAGLKKITRISEIPIIADESMYTSRGPLYLVDNDVCHGLNLRLSSCGGFRKTLAIYRQAKSKGMKIVIGSHVGESAILTYGGRHLAVMCPDVDYMEGSFSKYVLTADVTGDDVSFGDGGKVNVPTKPGLGVDIDTSALEMWSDRYAMLGA
jgi:L-alanine-DL-glutamate epimerase-like enolase superfamily enzyme